MRAEPICPRCAGALRPPDAWSSEWSCAAHGAVLPRQPAKQPNQDALSVVLADARVPVWTPWPLPLGWLVTGFGTVGDERSGARASIVALSGPNPLGGGHGAALPDAPPLPGEPTADLLLIAEQPGIGLGAYYSGLDGPDPGAGFDTGPPHAKIDISGPSATPGRSVPLWVVDSEPDRAVYVGEAMGDWLWAVLWPSAAGVLMLESHGLVDLREPGMELTLPFGAESARLDE
ncbi:DUF6758 family protein [Actinomadura parmotrematis]|uniref:Phosphotransacetylase n=1 Tax=Actinomadura parmotrematis TaxID=2864039 RepID=A0ABS7FLV3_9ACTN|nr:DUF6758 family protein [Actinomadura parmotrematis]MBW8481339.1 hypothetical protein [Actinomadura parmotrematis]